MEFLTPTMVDFIVRIVFMGIDFFSKKATDATERKKRFLIFIRAEQAKVAVVAKMSDEVGALIAEIKRESQR